MQPFYVPSDSMLPTLLVGDHVFVNKFLFGAGLTGTDVRFPGLREPKRGEVIVFQFARAPNGSGIFPADQRPELPRDAFVKRLIGLPGDRVAIVDGELVINGERVPREPTGKSFEDATGRRFDVYAEQLDGCRHWVLDDPGMQVTGCYNKYLKQPETFVEDYRRLSSLAAGIGIKGIVIWGFLRDSHGGVAAAKRVAANAAAIGVAIL